MNWTALKRGPHKFGRKKNGEKNTEILSNKKKTITLISWHGIHANDYNNLHKKVTTQRPYQRSHLCLSTKLFIYNKNIVQYKI